MGGCPPAPVEGLGKKLREKFNVVDTDEYMTSRTCNTCLGELTSYLNKIAITLVLCKMRAPER